MSAIRRMGVFVVALAVALALVAGQGPHTAAGATKGSYSGSWSGTQTTEGMNGSGAISFTVDAESGSFSGMNGGTRQGRGVNERLGTAVFEGYSPHADLKILCRMGRIMAWEA